MEAIPENSPTLPPKLAPNLSRRAAVALTLALAAWTWQVWSFYIPHGLTESLPYLNALIPDFTGFMFKSWWLDLAGACVLAFAALCAGASILDPLGVECDPLEHVWFSAGAGFSALILAASSLGLAAAFRPAALRILLVIFTLAAIPRAPREGRRLLQAFGQVLSALRREPIAMLPLALALPFCFFALIVAAAPETSYDALVAYFPYARLFMHRGTFSLIELHRSNMPLYGIVYYSLGLAAHGEPAARMLNYLTLPGLLLGVAILTRRIVSRPHAVAPALAVFFAASCPVLFTHATICLPDLPTALCCLLALAAALRQAETRSVAWAALAGGFAGMAAGMKYAGLYWVVIGGLIILSSGSLSNRSRAVRAAMVFSAVALAVFSPWLIRNWVQTGDPLHPSFQKYLKHPAVDPKEAQEHMNDALNYHRLPTTASNLLSMPWRLTMEGNRFQGTIGPVFLWSLPLVLIGFRRNRTWILAASALPFFALIWFMGPQWARYFLPGIPICAALAAAAVCHERIPNWLRIVFAATGVLLALVNLPGLNNAWAGGGGNTIFEISYDVAFGRGTPDEYRRRFIPGSDAVNYLNAQSLPDHTVVLPVHWLSLFPPWLSRMRVLDIWDNIHIVCRDSHQKSMDCYTVGRPALRENMDAAGVGVIGIRRDADWAKNRRELYLEDPFLRSNFRFIGYGGGEFFYQRNRPGPEPGFTYVNADLLNRLAVHLDAEADPSVRTTPVQSRGGDERLCLVFENSGAARFDVDLGDHPWLSFFLGWASGAGVDSGSEVIVEADGQKIWSHHFTPTDAPRGWTEYRVDLSAFNGRPVKLVLRAQPGTVSMADPVVYAHETDDPLPEESGPWRFVGASRRNPLQVRFTPERVHIGSPYTIEVPQLAGQWIDLLFSRNDGLPQEALRFRHLDARGQSVIPLPKDFQPMVVTVRGVRKAGDRLWMAANGKIEVVP